MRTSEIRDLIADLSRKRWEMEAALEENGGELTDELIAASADIDDLKALLRDEGVDELGRMLCDVQGRIETLKAEADTAARKLKNEKGYFDYLNELIGRAMDALETDACKGRFYGFKRTTSTRTEVLSEDLDGAFLEAATEAARNAGLPPYVDVTLKTNTTRIREYAAANEGEGAQFLWEDSTPALRFSKPRANAKKEEE